MDTTYFACTLGQASTLNVGPKPYRLISEFLSHQSKACGSHPAVGFSIPRQGKQWCHRLLTFGAVHAGAQVLAARLSKLFSSAPTAQTVALLCHSSPEFLFTWLALISLGHSVLLLAPQCQPTAIQHLCKSCNVSFLFYDASHAQRAREAQDLQDEESASRFSGHPIPLGEEEDIFHVIKSPQRLDPVLSDVDESSIAYLHHTSGTSSGLPKPIPQSHRAAIGALPHLPGTPSKATFTTTPLYHGGIADLFRSWTSDSMIWLFPSKDLPITARNICKCLEVAKSDRETPEIKYFSAVPYVLQLMEADEHGLEGLKSMDIVGVGGAALPVEVGDRMVGRGVNLISRFGSAECGFLLSSYRNFRTDREWQFLRDYNPPGLLKFEDRPDNLFELVVNPGWPHLVSTTPLLHFSVLTSSKAKKNREDGSFATADLFAKHPNVKNAWMYHSRADSQLTLITGKKFDPAPLEAAVATSPHLDDVLIYGNNRPCPGVLLIRSQQSARISDQELLNIVWPLIERLNQENQDHARIPRYMVVPVPHQGAPMEKSSKGTIIRRAAEARFATEISVSYESNEGHLCTNVNDAELPRHLTESIQSLLSKPGPIGVDADLFSYGLDSIAGMRLRSHLRTLLPNYCQDLPLSVVEDCGTVRRLSEYVIRKRHGVLEITEEDEKELMLNLVQEFTAFREISPRSLDQTIKHKRDRNHGEVVILTGATGALGAHILNVLRESNAVSTIYCLVRGVDDTAARERVNEALTQRGFADLSTRDKRNSTVSIIHAQLGESRLGISDDLYERLAAEADLILHVAWAVNFRLKLKSFVKDNIAGIKNLIELSRAVQRVHPPRFAYCSSTAAIADGKTDEAGYLQETICTDPASASPLGYSRSKWVAEQVCLAAQQQTSLRGNISVIRVGQLSGDSKTGIWNTQEAWPMMLSTVKLIGCLPDLGDESLDWLPVDVAAKAFVEAVSNTVENTENLPVYHVLNPYRDPTWRDMLIWLQKRKSFEVVDPREWVRRLEHENNTQHPALKLLGLWKEAYCTETREKAPKPKFAIAQTKQRVPTLQDVQPLDEAYMGRVWDWVWANVHYAGHL